MNDDQGDSYCSTNDKETFELLMDEDGRVSGIEGLSGLKFDQFRTVLDAFPVSNEELNRLCKDCLSIFGRDATFFLPATDIPRNSLEHFASRVFRAHTKDLIFSKNLSGAEWWVQWRKSSDQPILFHWDKDEGLVESDDLNVHPLISTVTYFSDCGPPTVVLKQRSTVIYTDAPDYGTIDTAYISYPAIGKHISFDGRYLHGCPPELSNCAKQGERLTFLVNIWLNYQPESIPIFPHDDADALDQLSISSDPFWSDDIDISIMEQSVPSLTISNGNSDEMVLVSHEFGPNRNDHRVSFFAPKLEDFNESTSLQLNYDKGHEATFQPAKSVKKRRKKNTILY